MSIIATALKHLIAAGVAGDDLVRAVAEMEAATDTRSTAAKRQARYRERNKASQTVTGVTSDDPLSLQVSPHTPFPNPIPDSPPYTPPNSIPSEQSSDGLLTPDEILTEWNDLAEQCGLPKAGKMTGGRLRQVKARLREYPELTAWQQAFRQIKESPFLQGKNDRGWRADFDFLLQAKSFARLTEGSYGQAC